MKSHLKGPDGQTCRSWSHLGSFELVQGRAQIPNPEPWRPWQAELSPADQPSVRRRCQLMSGPIDQSNPKGPEWKKSSPTGRPVSSGSAQCPEEILAHVGTIQTRKALTGINRTRKALTRSSQTLKENLSQADQPSVQGKC